jgi:hypothetical protein
MTPQAERNCVLEVVEQPCVGFAMNRDNVDTAFEISGRVIALRQNRDIRKTLYPCLLVGT